MDFNLTKDLIFFDIEATGLNVVRDRIVQIALVKYHADCSPARELEMKINPGIPISSEAIAVHGITPEQVANKPTFAQVADQLYEFIGSSDLAGYNSNRFDLPLLMEEFSRVGKEFEVSNRRLIDVQRIFYKMEPRTLDAALRFYCKEEIENAHDAMADVKATIAVLKGQLERYKGVQYSGMKNEVIEEPVRNDMQALHDFTSGGDFLDATQRLKLNKEGVVVFNFGKNVGKPVAETLYNDRQYYHWILNKEFSSQVKQIVKRLFKEYEVKMKSNEREG